MTQLRSGVWREVPPGPIEDKRSLIELHVSQEKDPKRLVSRLDETIYAGNPQVVERITRDAQAYCAANNYRLERITFYDPQGEFATSVGPRIELSPPPTWAREE